MSNLHMTLLMVATVLTIGNAFAPTLSHRTRAFDRSTSTRVYYSDYASTGTLTMKLASQGGSGKDSVLGIKNKERTSTAGRRGTKRFVDPGKVFVGGIPFDATERDLQKFFQLHLGHARNIHSIKIVKDWKTNTSKGYGFVIFADPMFATCAMEFCKNKKLKGRILTLNQGQKKIDPNTLYVKKNKKPAVDAEEAAIQAGMETAEGDDEEEEAAGDEWALGDFEDSDDAFMFADEDEDDDFQYDGTFEEMYPVQIEALSEEEEALNREQRREIQKRKPRKKPAAKGFMPTVE